WLPTFTSSLSLIAFAHPIIPALAATTKSFLPVAALERPWFPGSGWMSGFVLAPQLGWQFTATTYAAAQLRQRLSPLIAGDRGLVADLPVTIETESGERTMICEPPKPRFSVLRTAAGFSLQILTSLPSL